MNWFKRKIKTLVCQHEFKVLHEYKIAEGQKVRITTKICTKCPHEEVSEQKI